MSRNNIILFLARTKKATAALLSAATAVSSATFIPEPWNYYAATLAVILTWLVTYAVPFVDSIVEADVPGEAPVEPATDEIAEAPVTPVTGEVSEPPTVEIPRISAVPDTVGIPVVEGDDARPFGPTVDDILDRLKAEGWTPSVPA